MGKNNHEPYDYEAEKAKHDAEMDAIVEEAMQQEREMEEEENKEMEKNGYSGRNKRYAEMR